MSKTDPDPDSLAGRLDPAIASYQWPPVTFGTELARLETVLRVDAPEAAVLYASRILEALACAALEAAGLEGTSNCFSNLLNLEHYHLYDPGRTGHWAHALRRLGNDVRHLRRAVSAEDARLAVLFSERCLDWYFREFRFGRNLKQLTVDGRPMFASVDPELERFVREIDGGRLSAEEFLARFLRQSPVLPSVFAEELLNRDRTEDAQRVLAEALRRFPDDLRLLQLQGLLWSRVQNLDQALGILEPLYQRFRDDTETAGILAGACKRAWNAEPGRREWLSKAHQAYVHGWESSKKTSAWLGINGAATALWLGKGGEARARAGEVRLLLEKRRGALRAEGALNYWDLATLGEALLMCGEIDLSLRKYSEAFGNDPEATGKHKVSRKQVDDLLRAMGFSAGAASAYWGRARVREGVAALRVGVTGHRRLPESDGLKARIREEVEGLKLKDPGKPLVIVSPLAEGADRLVAAAVLEAGPEGSLEVVLPVELEDYLQDFATADSRREFQQLYDRASRVVYPAPVKGVPSPESRNQAYAQCGAEVVRRSDVLIAIWDGKPAAGLGGTAEVVALARSVHKPLIWINPDLIK